MEWWRYVLVGLFWVCVWAFGCWVRDQMKAKGYDVTSTGKHGKCLKRN